MAKKKKFDKDEMIKQEVERLMVIFSELSESRVKATESLIQEAAFMRATLFELKELINRDGVIDEMPQGEYSILRESPAVKTYNTMIQRYSGICKQLFDLLPKEEARVIDDGFEDFMYQR